MNVLVKQCLVEHFITILRFNAELIPHCVWSFATNKICDQLPSQNELQGTTHYAMQKHSDILVTNLIPLKVSNEA